MRVIHILDHSIPLETTYARHTLRILASQRALGWETFQLTGPNQGTGTVTEERIDGWVFYRTPQPGGILESVPALAALESMGEIAYRIERLAHRVRPHILHAHSPIINAIPALRVGRRLGIPVVYEVRAFDSGGSRTRDLPAILTRRIETWVLNRADAVLTECEALRRDMVIRGVPATKVTLTSCADIGTREGDGQAESDLPASDVLHGGRSYCHVYEQLMGAM